MKVFDVIKTIDTRCYAVVYMNFLICFVSRSSFTVPDRTKTKMFEYDLGNIILKVLNNAS